MKVSELNLREYAISMDLFTVTEKKNELEFIDYDKTYILLEELNTRLKRSIDFLKSHDKKLSVISSGIVTAGTYELEKMRDDIMKNEDNKSLNSDFIALPMASAFDKFLIKELIDSELKYRKDRITVMRYSVDYIKE